MIRRTPRAIVTIALSILGLAAAFSGGSAAALPANSPTPTVVMHVRPVTTAGQLASGYTITKQLRHGNCETGSEATGNAYRCFSHNAVLDPCWVTSAHAYVDCLTEAWSHSVTRLHVTKGYLNYGGLGRQSILPWGVQLDNGTKCGLLQGATAAVDEMRVNYGCQHTKKVLVGEVIKHGKVWKLREAKPVRGGYKIIGKVPLAVAWFGRRSAKS